MQMKALIQSERNGHVQGKKEALPPTGEQFIRLMLAHPSYDEAVRRVTEHAEQEWDARHAQETEVLKQECPMRDERASTTLEEVRALEEQRRATPSFLIVPACRRNHG